MPLQELDNPQEEAPRRHSLDEFIGGPTGGPSSLSRPSKQEPSEDPEKADGEDASLLGKVADAGQAVVRGAAGAINETGRTVQTLNNAFARLFGQDEHQVEQFDMLSEERLPEVEDSGFNGAVESMSQFIVGMVGAGKVLKPLQLGTKAYAGLRAAGLTGRGAGKARNAAKMFAKAVPFEAAGAVSDFVAMDPWEERVADLLANAPMDFVQPVGRFLQADEDDPELWARTKAAVEGGLLGMALGGTIAGVAYGVRRTGIIKRFRAGKIDKAQADLELSNAAKAMQEDAERLSEQEAFAIRHGDDGPELVVKDGADDAAKELEGLQVRAEQQVAAFNSAYLHRTADVAAGRGMPPTAQLKDAVLRIRQRVVEGAEPGDAELYRDIGMNLGLITKTYDDFKAVSKSVREAFRKEHVEAHARVRDGHEENTWAAIDQRALEKVQQIFGEDNLSLDEIVEWANREIGGSSVKDAAVNVQAGMKTLMLIGQDIARVARTYDLSDGPEKEFLGKMLEDMTQSFADIHVAVAGAKSEGGRFLNSLKMAGMSADEAKAKAAASKVGDRGATKLSKEQARELARNLRLTKGDPEQIRKVLMHTADVVKHNAKDPSKIDRINWFRVGMMLSGPKTQAVNLFNNMFVAFELPVEHMWAGFRSKDRQLQQFGQDEIAGMMANMGEAFRMARESWKSGQNLLDPMHRVDEGIMDQSPSPLSWIGQRAKALVDLPGKALMTTDEFFKQLNYRNHVRAQALMSAREDAVELGLKGQDLDDFLQHRTVQAMEGAFTDAGHAMNPFALQHARYSTFTDDLGEGTWGNTWRELANKHPEFRFVMPFIRTPVNIFRFSWQRTPLLGRLQKDMQADLAAGGQRAAMAKAKLEVGWALWGSGALLAASHKITGAGPSNPQLRKQWLDAGNQPYSFQFPNGDQISYRRIEPLATAIGIVADGVEAFGELNEEDMTTVAYAAAGALMSSVSSKTFLQGLSDAFGALEEGDTYKVVRLFNNFATSFVPNAANQLNPDPYYREARGLIDEFRKKVPGLSDDLEPRRNLFGERVMKPAMAFGMEFGGVGNYINRSLNPFTTMRPPEDAEMRQQLVDLGKALPMPQPTWMDGQIDLRDRKKYDNGTGQSPYDRMFEIVSEGPGGQKPLREAMEELVEKDQWQRLGGGVETFKGGAKYEAARMIVQKYYQVAEAMVKREYPKLLDEERRLKGVKLEGFRPEGSSQQARDQNIFNR